MDFGSDLLPWIFAIGIVIALLGRSGRRRRWRRGRRKAYRCWRLRKSAHKRCTSVLELPRFSGRFMAWVSSSFLIGLLEAHR